MKLLALGLASGLLLLASPPSAATTAFQFSGEVTKDSFTSASYGLLLEPGEVAILDMPDNLKLELSTPVHHGNGTTTLVRLLRQRAGSSNFEIFA